MRDWKSIIKQAEEEGSISKKEAEELNEKLAGLKSGIGKTFGWLREAASKAVSGLKKPENLPLIILSTMAMPAAAEIASSVYRPVKHNLQYNAMKKELVRVHPEFAKIDDERLRKVFGLVTVISPILASHPVTAAAAVRENIDTPDVINVQSLSAMARIQRDVSDAKAKQYSSNIGALVTRGAGEGAKMISDLSRVGVI